MKDTVPAKLKFYFILCWHSLIYIFTDAGFHNNNIWANCMWVKNDCNKI